MIILMGKKQTGELEVLTDQSFSEKTLVINPNDGFDLGLMMTEVTVELNFILNSDGPPQEQNSEALIARIIQKNECCPGTVELGAKSIKKLDGNTKVRLYLEEQDGYPKLFIDPV